MSLDPQARDSWRGLMELLRPPAGYQLGAAVGTTFGMSFDALVASLLAMLDSDGEGLAEDPLAGLIAATKLAGRVRIFVQAGSISGSSSGVPARLAALLDRMILPIRPQGGIFHPKLWALRYISIVGGRDQPDRVRVVVGSRNLVPSSALELGVAIEGFVGTRGSAFGLEVASAITACFNLAPPNCPAVKELPAVLKRTTFAIPDEGRDSCQLWWQGSGQHRHSSRLPVRAKRAFVLSPFLSADFLNALLVRTSVLRVVSTPTAFRRLDEATFTTLRERARQQKSPAMYVVGDDFGDDDTGRLDGLHAKLVIFDQGKGEAGSKTFLGSANATGAGWALTGAGNVECLMELQPGISMDRLIRDFLLEKKESPKPWIREFEEDDRQTLSVDEKLQDRLLSIVRGLAARRFRLTYERPSQVLSLRLAEAEHVFSVQPDDAEIHVDCVPFGSLEESPQWQPFAALASGPLQFPAVDISAVSAFVVIRARAATGAPVTRLAFADLQMTEADISARDAAARQQLLANARTEDILRALVFGIARVRRDETRSQPGTGNSRHSGMSHALVRVTLERLLQAVALSPDVLRELRLLMADRADDAFNRFQNDLEAAAGYTAEESQ
jgi:hypothetical protein